VGTTAIERVEDGLKSHVTQFEGPLESLLFLSINDKGAEFILLDATGAWPMQHPDQVLVRHDGPDHEITSKQECCGECKRDQGLGSQEAMIACDIG
jgi:hypothetical protein